MAALFGFPLAHEDDPERAARAPLDIVERVRSDEIGLQLRVAVETGEAFVRDAARGHGLAAGDVMNTAARLQSAASRCRSLSARERARVPLADSSSLKGEVGRARLAGAPSIISVNMNAVRKITLACIRPGRRRSCGNDGWSGLIRSSSSDLALRSKRRREAASAT